MICSLYMFLNTCKHMLLIMSVCSEFPNFTPYNIEMHIDFTLVWARWTLNVYFWRVSYICTYRLNIVCKLSGSSLWYALNIIIDVLYLTKSTYLKMQSCLKRGLRWSRRLEPQTRRTTLFCSTVIHSSFVAYVFPHISLQ